jgi:formate--tetrahydrofolate ligase
LVQTTDGTPAFVNTGPFGNTAPGTSSVICQEMGLRLADYVVNEAGFGSDLGAEKYFDIVLQQSGIKPAAAVLVTTIQSIRKQGQGRIDHGFPNLRKHIEILKGFGVPVIASLNRFPADTDADLEQLADFCSQHGVPSAVSESFSKGGPGAKELAERVIETIAANPEPPVRPIYSLDEPLMEKIQRVAQKIYGAADVTFSDQARTKLDQFARWGCSRLPICVAKTQYSLSDDPKLLGAPTGWTLHVTDVSLSAGARFVVVITGNMMLMPGLPKVSRAASIDLDDSRHILNV